MKIQFIKDDGTPKGAWIAVGITLVWVVVHVVAFFWKAGAENLSVIDAAFTAGCLSFVGMYFLKKYKETGDEEVADLGGLLDRVGAGSLGCDTGAKDRQTPGRNRSPK